MYPNFPKNRTSGTCTGDCKDGPQARPYSHTYSYTNLSHFLHNLIFGCVIVFAVLTVPRNLHEYFGRRVLKIPNFHGRSLEETEVVSPSSDVRILK